MSNFCKVGEKLAAFLMVTNITKKWGGGEQFVLLQFAATKKSKISIEKTRNN